MTLKLDDDERQQTASQAQIAQNQLQQNSQEQSGTEEQEKCSQNSGPAKLDGSP
jgi:hypothetical protein